MRDGRDGTDWSAHFERFFDTAADLLCIADLDGFIRVANPAWQQVLGWSPDELSARPYIDFVHPDDVAATLAAAETLARGDPLLNFVNRYRVKGGGWRDLEWSSVARQADGLIYATVRDITGYRRAAAHALEIEQITGVGSWEVDIESRTIWWSHVTCAIHDVEPGHAPTCDEALAFYPPQARETIMAAVERLTATGIGYDLELPLVTARGRAIWVRTTGVAEQRSGHLVRAFGTIKDVTRQRAERTHLARLAAVAENTVNAVIVTDAHGRVEWVNTPCERITGYTIAEMAGQKPGRLLQCELTDPATVTAVGRALDAGEGIDVEILNRSKQGQDYWIRMDIQPLRGEDGSLAGFVSIESDITERKAGEAALRMSEEKYRALVERSHDIVYTLDRDGVFTYVSPGWTRLLCQPVADVIGRPHADFVHPDDHERLAGAIRRVIAKGRSLDDVECRIRHADGRWVWHVANMTPLRDAAGAITGLQGHAVDATARKAAEAEHARSARLGRMIEDSLTEVFVFDADTLRFVEVNRGARDNLGYSLEELRRMTPLDITPEMDATRFAAVVAPLRDGRQPLAAFRTPHRRRDGSTYSAEIRLQFTVDDRPLFVAMVQDVTARDAAEAALIAAREKAEEASRTKSLFLANMSHEIRTPMNGVLGMATVLDGALTDPAHRKMLSVIRESGELLLGVINDILDLSKIEAGKLSLEIAPFLPADLARKIEGIYTLKAAEKNISFSVLCSSGTEAPRLGDAHRIMQILHNLISNAIKFTRSGEVTVSIGGRRDRPLTVEVLDTGIGMTDAQSARIFDDFAQADNSTTRLYGGTGLGMSIVKRIVEAMHGTVSVQSRPGEGTRVRVSLPLEVVEADIAPAAQATPIAADATLAIRVLAAEDNVINQMVLSAMLARLGSTVTLVANGAEAVEAWSPGAFDVVLLDVSMPVMDGPTALHRIRAQELAGGHARTPTVAVTANALHHQVEAYLAEGFDGHVAKPIDPASLEATLRRVLRGQTAPVRRSTVDAGEKIALPPA